MLNELETPCLLLDEMRLRRNIRRLRERLAHLGVAFRPHLKSAKSIEVARLAMTSPGGPATVSTLREADYFAENGVTDMIYGVGIAPAKLPRVSALRGRGVDLAVILDSLEQAEAVAAFGLETRDCIPALIELDADGHRGGISPGDTQTLLAIARCLERAGSFRGVLSHAGGAYDLSDESDLVAAALVERDTAVAAANFTAGRRPQLPRRQRRIDAHGALRHRSDGGHGSACRCIHVWRPLPGRRRHDPG